MGRISIVAIDLDDTLLLENKCIEPKAKKMIGKLYSQGIHVVLATGRGVCSAREYADELGIKSPIISGNGARITDPEKSETWLHSPVPHKTAEEIAKTADENRWDLIISTGENLYRTGYCEPVNAYYEAVYVDSNADAVKKVPECIIPDSKEAIVYIGDIYRNKYSRDIYCETFYNSDGSIYSMGVFNRKANKGYALKFLAEKMGIPGREILAIGDNVNDISMFKYAGTAVAMGNAGKDVKKYAGFTAPSNSEGGVLWALEKFF